jgi:hypothetical protein
VAFLSEQELTAAHPREAREPIERHTLDVYIANSRLVDVRVDGESVFPTWFKLEFKESGDISAKVKGLRLSGRGGDTINIHQGAPDDGEVEAAQPADER